MPAKSKGINLLTPRSYYEDFRSLLRSELELDKSFKAEYLLKEVESKLLDLEYSETPQVRRDRAIEKWLDCEVRNRDTSSRLIIADESDVVFLQDETFPVSIEDVLTTARRFIRDVIGNTPSWDELKGSFSGGASTSIRRGTGTIARKYQEGSNITEAAIMPFLRLTKSDVWAPREFILTEGNVMFTVPKSSNIDRAAAKEPEYNMYVQKAIGDFFRRKLMRVGINLNDQSVNQRLAKEGSVKGNLATIDLSSASDSITRQLVLMLVPDDWFHLMDAVRSPVTRIDDIVHENFMFSSMGNGYTFELESLIFWALTRAVCYLQRHKGRISVYGDDIICPVGALDALVETFTFCGFTINLKKSHYEGNFRESCGKHWFSGLDVTPFYVKKVPEDVSDWCLLLNSLRRWSDCVGGICDPTYHALWQLFAEEIIPKPLWGGNDMSVRSNLASAGRSPLARCVRKQRRDKVRENEYSKGAYLHWLSVAEDRSDAFQNLSGSNELVTSEFIEDGDLVIKKAPKLPYSRDIPLFPQELLCLGEAIAQ